MPLTASSLTTIINARLWCLRDSEDASKDDLFTLLINSVSRQVIRYCQRQFFPETGATKLFPYDGGSYLNLAPYEIQAGGETPIIIDTPAGGTPVTLDPTNPNMGTLYKSEPRNATDEGTYLWVRLPEFHNPGAVPAGSRVGLMNEIAITADWGMAALPEDLEEAVLTIIEDRYLNPAAEARIQVGPAQIEPVQPRDDEESPFPRRATEILDGIRRSVWAA